MEKEFKNIETSSLDRSTSKKTKVKKTISKPELTTKEKQQLNTYEKSKKNPSFTRLRFKDSKPEETEQMTPLKTVHSKLSIKSDNSDKSTSTETEKIKHIPKTTESVWKIPLKIVQSNLAQQEQSGIDQDSNINDKDFPSLTSTLPKKKSQDKINAWSKTFTPKPSIEKEEECIPYVELGKSIEDFPPLGAKVSKNKSEGFITKSSSDKVKQKLPSDQIISKKSKKPRKKIEGLSSEEKESKLKILKLLFEPETIKDIPVRTTQLHQDQKPIKTSEKVKKDKQEELSVKSSSSKTKMQETLIKTTNKSSAGLVISTDNQEITSIESNKKTKPKDISKKESSVKIKTKLPQENTEKSKPIKKLENSENLKPKIPETTKKKIQPSENKPKKSEKYKIIAKTEKLDSSNTEINTVKKKKRKSKKKNSRREINPGSSTEQSAVKIEETSTESPPLMLNISKKKIKESISLDKIKIKTTREEEKKIEKTSRKKKKTAWKTLKPKSSPDQKPLEETSQMKSESPSEVIENIHESIILSDNKSSKEQEIIITEISPDIHSVTLEHEVIELQSLNLLNTQDTQKIKIEPDTFNKKEQQNNEYDTIKIETINLDKNEDEFENQTLYTSLCSSSDSINIQIDNEEIQRNIKELTEKLILEKSYSSKKSKEDSVSLARSQIQESFDEIDDSKDKQTKTELKPKSIFTFQQSDLSEDKELTFYSVPSKNSSDEKSEQIKVEFKQHLIYKPESEELEELTELKQMENISEPSIVETDVEKITNESLIVLEEKSTEKINLKESEELSELTDVEVISEIKSKELEKINIEVPEKLTETKYMEEIIGSDQNVEELKKIDLEMEEVKSDLKINDVSDIPSRIEFEPHYADDNLQLVAPVKETSTRLLKQEMNIDKLVSILFEIQIVMNRIVIRIEQMQRFLEEYKLKAISGSKQLSTDRIQYTICDIVKSIRIIHDLLTQLVDANIIGPVPQFHCNFTEINIIEHFCEDVSKISKDLQTYTDNLIHLTYDAKPSSTEKFKSYSEDINSVIHSMQDLCTICTKDIYLCDEACGGGYGVTLNGLEQEMAVFMTFKDNQAIESSEIRDQKYDITTIKKLKDDPFLQNLQSTSSFGSKANMWHGLLKDDNTFYYNKYNTQFKQFTKIDIKNVNIITATHNYQKFQSPFRAKFASRVLEIYNYPKYYTLKHIENIFQVYFRYRNAGFYKLTSTSGLLVLSTPADADTILQCAWPQLLIRDMTRASKLAKNKCWVLGFNWDRNRKMNRY